MEQVKLGIEQLKKLIKFSCDLTKQVNTSGADGWQWTDSFAFIDEAAQVPGIGKSLPEIAKELADLSSEEKEELKVYVQTEFDIPNDSVEVVVENSIIQAVSLVALITEWKNIEAKKAK